MSTTSFTHIFTPGTSERTLLLLHGTGGNEHSLIEISEMIDPAAAQLSPRGNVLEHGMPRFFRRFSEGIFDEADLRKQSADLTSFISSASGHYHIKQDALCAVGYSNGANIAASILLLHPEAFSAAILLRPMLPLIPEILPNLSDHRILIVSGEHDFMVKRESVLKLEDIFIKAGAEVTMLWQPRGHDISMSDILIAKEWLENLS